MDIGETSGISSEQAGEWLERLEPPPADVGQLISRLLDDAADEIAGRPPGTRWRESQDLAEALEKAMSRADVADVNGELDACVLRGNASTELAEAWRRHVLAEITDVYLIQPDVNAELRWKKSVPARLAQFLSQVDIEIVPSLGAHVAAATFVGPTRMRVVLGADSFVDAIHAEFLTFHMFLHGVMGDLPIEGFACRIEYRQNSEDPWVLERLVDQPYREAEARVNDAASCAMYDYYVDGQSIAPLSRSVVREALRRGLANVPLLRFMMRDRPALRQEVSQRVAHYSRVKTLARRTVLRVKFRQHVAVVREKWWRGIFLIWRDPDGSMWRKAVPSRKVLVRLGFRLDDVAAVSASRLAEYRDAGILIDPDDVEWIHQLLIATTGPAVGPLSNQLIGLKEAGLDEALSERLASPRGEGHRTELTPRVEAALASFHGGSGERGGAQNDN